MPKIRVIALIALLVIVVVTLSLVVWYKSFLGSPVDKDLVLDIAPGTARVDFINEVSKKAGLSNVNVQFLKLYIYNNKNLPFEAGQYSFDANTTYRDLFSNLRGGTTQVKVTFLEGWRVEENALELKRVLGSDYALDYLKEAEKFQGYLYPDTYFVDPNTSPADLIAKQKENYNSKLSDLLKIYRGSLSQEEVIIIASILERESLPNDDKNLIAGVLLNRYFNDYPLDADATTQYVVGSELDAQSCIEDPSCQTLSFWPKSLTKDQLDSDDPYNTRGRLGLPPKPIANPSFDSVEAVVNPVETNYLFYLHDSQGNTYFANTIDEHVENIRRYL